MRVQKAALKSSSPRNRASTQKRHNKMPVVLKRLTSDLVENPIASRSRTNRIAKTTASTKINKYIQSSARTEVSKRVKRCSTSARRKRNSLQNVKIDSDDEQTYYVLSSDCSISKSSRDKRVKRSKGGTKSQFAMTKPFPYVKPGSTIKSLVSEETEIRCSSPMMIKPVVFTDIESLSCEVMKPPPNPFTGLKSCNVRPVDRIPIAPYTQSPESNRSLRNHEPSRSVIRRFTNLHSDTPPRNYSIPDNTKRSPSVSSYRSVSPAISERRLSVRQSAGTLKYKHIMVKRATNYIQVILDATVGRQKNVLTVKALKELTAVLNSSKYDDKCAVVLITGSDNGTFCSGLDLTYLTTGDIYQAARTMSDTLVEFVRTVLSFPKPLVAAVNGQAVGCGVGLLPLCDVVYASDKATFFTPYAQLNQVPEAGLSCSLSQVVGIALANEMLMAGRMLTALEAYQMGLVAHVFWPTGIMQEVIPRITNMAASCTSRVLNATKSLIRSQHRERFLAACHAEASMQVEIWSTPECQRNMKMFLDQ